MHIQIAAVGKIKEKYLADGIAEYAKRLRPYVKFDILEVPDEKVPETMSPAEEAQAREREGERLLALIKPDALVIALTLDGELGRANSSQSGWTSSAHTAAGTRCSSSAGRPGSLPPCCGARSTS